MLSEPEKALIPESMAHRLFGKESAIGKQIVSDGGIWTNRVWNILVVGGVYKDFPENTQLKKKRDLYRDVSGLRTDELDK